jgi:PAS domain S-box-containing protein
LQSTANLIDGKILTISRDITNKKKSEEELKESEEKYRSLVENIQEGIWQIGMDGRTVFVNEKMTELFGYNKEEMIGKNLFDFMDDKWIEIAKEKLENRKKGEKEIHEFEFLKKNGKKIYCLLSTTPLMEDGKYTGALASLIDITEKKEVEKKNKQSQESYETIFNLSTDAIFVHDYKTGKIIDVNKCVLDKFGYTKEEIKNLNVGDLSVNTVPYTQKEAAEWIKKAMTEGPQNFEWCSKTKNGGIIWHESVLQKVNIGGEERILVIGRDVTKRKEAEEEIRKSEEKYRELFNNALVGIDIHNSDGSIFAVNKTAEKIFGLSEEELKKKDLSFWKGKLIKPDGTEMEAKDFPLSIVAENKKPSEGTIVGLKMSEKDSVIWLLHSARPMLDKNGEIDKVVTSFVEITEHKKTEEKLKETKNHLQTIIDKSPSGIITVDNKGIITSWSPSCEQIFGWKKEEVIGKFNPTVPVEMKDFYIESIKKAQNNLELKPLTKNRGFIDISISKTPLTNKNNEVIGCLGVMTDITEKRKHDEEIRKFKTISDKAKYGVNINTIDGTTVYVNDAFAEMHGYTKEELVGKPHDILHIDEEMSTTIKDARERLKKGEHVFIEETHKKKDGTTIPVQVNASIILGNDGQPMFIAGIISDITKQKELTNKLKESENLFRTLIEQSSSGVYIHDPVKNKLFYANPLIREILGINEEDIEKTDLFKYLNPDDAKLIKEITRKRLTGEKTDPSAEVRIYPPGKKEMWVRLYTTFIKYKGVTAALASVIDITESKEVRLKEKERLEELQRYKDATIGREMRVIELKREVNKICKEQGLALKYKDTDEKIEEQNSMETTP